MSFTSAHFANAEKTAIVATSEENGAEVVSKIDNPARWAELLASGIAIDAYAPPPVPAPRLSSTQFMDLFTDDEQLAIVGATLTDPPIKLFYDRALAAEFIDLGSQRVLDGTAALVSQSLITSARRARILQGLAPE